MRALVTLLPLRFKAPIFTYKAILDKAGIYLKTTPKKKKDDITEDEEAVIEELITGEDRESVAPKGENYSKYTLKELNSMLDQAVANEDYETAARIRDEISKR